MHRTTANWRVGVTQGVWWYSVLVSVLFELTARPPPCPDRKCRLCLSLALWNGKDPILKERLFGVTGPQGCHGEDVKELYY